MPHPLDCLYPPADPFNELEMVSETGLTFAEMLPSRIPRRRSKSFSKMWAVMAQQRQPQATKDVLKHYRSDSKNKRNSKQNYGGKVAEANKHAGDGLRLTQM